MKEKILIVESDETLALVMTFNLQSEGYEVTRVKREDELRKAVITARPDLIVLGTDDLDKSRIKFCESLRDDLATKGLPVVMVATLEDAKHDCCGRSTKPNDYIIQPFSMSEFVVSVKMALRRALRTLIAGDLLLDRECNYAARQGRQLRLGPTDYRLLEVFMEHPGKIFTRAEILVNVWGANTDISARTIDVHIGRLRKALIRGQQSDPIRTVKGAGYGLVPDTSVSKVQYGDPAGVPSRR